MSTEQAAELLALVQQTNQHLEQVLQWQHAAQQAAIYTFYGVCAVVFFSILGALLRR